MLSVKQLPDQPRFIHLLYAPTNFCNMGCQYCYLGTGTDEKNATNDSLSTLQKTVEQFLDNDIIPFNLSFHGGEATTVPKKQLEALLAFAQEHYRQHGQSIKQAGFPLNPVHIKTNLYNFDKLFDLFAKYEVSISGSVDLPLSMHEKYRTDKKGRSTLPKILDNLHLLAKYPFHKKISCVVTKEHLTHLDEFVADIRYLHFDVGLDMTKFNIMFSFDNDKNVEKFGEKIVGTEMLSEDEQLMVYQRLHQEFANTELEAGLKEHWFKEFTPEFCCSAVNCGDKFFLLQQNGDVYACPRGQASKSFFYGNVYESPVTEIMENGWKTIEALENQLDASEDCFSCNYMPYCNLGCVFVRKESGLNKSYTCKLQKAIYQDNPQRYPAYSDEFIADYAAKYKFHNNLKSFKPVELMPAKKRFVSDELFDDENALSALIEKDPVLQKIYADDQLRLLVDGVPYTLRSPVLSNQSDVAMIQSSSKVLLELDESMLGANAKDWVNNYLMIMLLRNTMVQYGDENRVKQEHIFDYQLYNNTLSNAATKVGGMLQFDLMPLLQLHRHCFLPDVRNNIYVTTKSLREYHYQKQQKNAFYHIQAINLPFPFLEFYWRD